MNRYQAMIDAGYEPGKTYGSMPLCFCGRKPTHVVPDNGQLKHLCACHYQAWRTERAR